MGKKISGKEVDNRGEREEEGTEECSSWNAACTASAAKPNEQAESHTKMAYYIVLKLSHYCNQIVNMDWAVLGLNGALWGRFCPENWFSQKVRESLFLKLVKVRVSLRTLKFIQTSN